MIKTYNHNTSCINMQIICVDGKCIKSCLSMVLNEKNMLKFKEDFIKNYNENSDNGNNLEVYVEYCKYLHGLHSDLPFLPERMKINKYNKLVCNLYDKNNYVVHIRSLKQALNGGLILKKVYKGNEINQKNMV